MKIISFDSFPIIIVKMKVGQIRSDEGSHKQILDSKSKFFFVVKGSIANKLSVGDDVTVICIPHKSLELVEEVLFLGKKRRLDTEIFIGKNTYWQDYYYENIVDVLLSGE